MDAINNEDIDFSEMCRACALPFNSGTLKDITPPIRQSLLFCAGVEVNLMSDLPTRICEACSTQAESACQFKLKCQLAQEKIHELARKKNGLVASTPRHLDDCDIDNFQSPRTLLSDMDIALSPLQCHSAFKQILEPKLDSTSNLEDNSSLTNLLNEVLDYNDDNIVIKDANLVADKESHLIADQDGITEADAESKSITSQTIHPNSLLFDSFKEDNPILDESLNLESPFQSLNCVIADVSQIGTLDVDVFFQHVVEKNYENINEIKPFNSLPDNNNSEATADVTVNKAPSSEQAAIIHQTESADIAKIKICQIEIRDFMKFVLPKKYLNQELQILGYVRCRFCFKAFENIEMLSDHMIRKHPTECADCTETADCIKLLFPEEKFKQTPMKKYYRCVFCTCPIRSIENLYKHFRKFHLEEARIRLFNLKCASTVYICDHCNLKFKNRNSLYKHLILHGKRMQTAQAMIWTCDKCNKKFDKLAAYKSHLKAHNLKLDEVSPKIDLKVGTSMCPVCGKIFTRKSNLTAHMQKHNPENIVECTVCQKMFSTRRHLNHHMKIHNKNFECDVCKKKFARSDNLTTHMRVHTGERNYKCRKCDIRLSVRSLIKRHFVKHHCSVETSETPC